ncbi:unnamed protein product [Blepharisma stoltei]|uniref:Uncharacterized protein n=1 Tax=Blepharisma stoltei TaxID=1481888 RepID=A0AAU9J0U3_9CILI|nr:unnamed protein product [Blepharisma stoltei]
MLLIKVLYYIFRLLGPVCLIGGEIATAVGSWQSFIGRDEYVGACDYIVTKSYFEKITIVKGTDGSCEAYKDNDKDICHSSNHYLKHDFGEYHSQTLELVNISFDYYASLLGLIWAIFVSVHCLCFLFIEICRRQRYYRNYSYWLGMWYTLFMRYPTITYSLATFLFGSFWYDDCLGAFQIWVHSKFYYYLLTLTFFLSLWPYIYLYRLLWDRIGLNLTNLGNTYKIENIFNPAERDTTKRWQYEMVGGLVSLLIIDCIIVSIIGFMSQDSAWIYLVIDISFTSFAWLLERFNAIKFKYQIDGRELNGNNRMRMHAQYALI